MRKLATWLAGAFLMCCFWSCDESEHPCPDHADKADECDIDPDVWPMDDVCAGGDLGGCVKDCPTDVSCEDFADCLWSCTG